ncbi:MAG: pyridoxamine 5'-phosphate oxidase family protein [Kofleriaceae bacterium]|nr:pyridoxamine 5'-phosphate oxidase family protein [Kofleriaceae bacterium]
MNTLEPTERTRLRRKPGRGSFDVTVVNAILDEALVCHVGFTTGAAPIVIPTTHVRVEDRLYVHGSAASHMLGTLAKGIEVCVAVTLLDALVFARTAFHHSVNYRSVVLFGTARLVDEPAEKRRALAALIDKLAPDRSAACRAPDDKELAATKVIAVPIEEASAKIRTGPPLADEGDDAALPYWAGILPVRLARGTAQTAPDCTAPPPPDLG